MKIVACLSLSNMNPKVWDSTSPYYLKNLEAVMISYAEFDQKLAKRRKAMEQGLHTFLGVSEKIKIYLDNGAFFISRSGGEVSRQEYEEFIKKAKPDWYPIPQDYIPFPKMSNAAQLACLQRTMEVNWAYCYNGFVPVIHISRHLDKYLKLLNADERLREKPAVALGGIVPNLLRSPKAMSYNNLLNNMYRVRTQLANKQLHVFGIGGTATLHIAALLKMDSVDSSGWRNRAARGIIQLPGSGERMIAELGNWKGRRLEIEELMKLQECTCPACQQYGIKGLELSGINGFCNRATHNLWILIEEARLINDHLIAGTYKEWYKEHLVNSTYRQLIDKIVEMSLNCQAAK